MADIFGIRNPNRYANINRPFATQFLGLADQDGTGAPVSPNLLPLRQAVLQQQMRPQRTAAQQMMALPTRIQQQAPKAPPSLGDRISGMMPKAGTPEAAGLGAAGAKMLQLSGYSDRPIAMSQILGEAAQAYTTARKETAAEQAATLKAQQELERQRRQDALAERLTEAKLYEIYNKSPDSTSLLKNLRAAGIDPNSPEGREIIKNFLTKPQTSIDMSKPSEAALGYAYKQLEKQDEAVGQAQELVDEYRFIETALRDPNIKTGLATSIAQPVKRALLALDLLDEEEADKVMTLETLEAAMKKIVPRMRDEGSGSTSNFEFANYQKAAPELGKSTEANQLIAAMARQAAERKIEIQDIRRQFVLENNRLPTNKELGEKVESRLGSVYKTPFGTSINQKDAAEVDAEVDRMIRENIIRSGDVVYLGKHSPQSKMGGFMIFTDEMIQAAQQ